jgi:hypothetical protein
MQASMVDVVIDAIEGCDRMPWSVPVGRVNW